MCSILIPTQTGTLIYMVRKWSERKNINPLFFMSLSTPCTHNQTHTYAHISTHPPTYVVYAHTHRESQTLQWLISLQTSFCWRGMRLVGVVCNINSSFPTEMGSEEAWAHCFSMKHLQTKTAKQNSGFPAFQHTPHTGLSLVLLHNLAGKQNLPPTPG